MKRNLMLAAAFATAFVSVAANAGLTTAATTKYAAEFYSGTATDTLLPAAASSFAFTAGTILPLGTLVNVTLSEGEWFVPSASTMTSTGGTVAAVLSNNGVLLANSKTVQFKVDTASTGAGSLTLVLAGGKIKGLKAGSAPTVTFQVTNAAGTSVIDSAAAATLLTVANGLTTTITAAVENKKIDVITAGNAGKVLLAGAGALATDTKTVALGTTKTELTAGYLSPATADTPVVTTAYGALTAAVSGASLAAASSVFSSADTGCATPVTQFTVDATDAAKWTATLIGTGTDPLVTPRVVCAKFDKATLAVIAPSTPSITTTLAALGTAGNSQVATVKTGDLYKLVENGSSVTMGSYYEPAGASDLFSTYTRVQNTGTTDSVIQVSYRGPDGVATAAGALKGGAVLKAGAHMQYTPADIKAAVVAANVKPGYGALTFTAGTASLSVQPLLYNSATGQLINMAPVEKSAN